MAVKRPTTGQRKKKTDILASKFYRAQTPYCELAGKDFIHCNGNLQWMHIISRNALCIRYEPFNKLVGCTGHHVWYTHNPVDWVRFLEKNFPERLHQAETHRWDLTKPDYEAWQEKFKQN